ncbi:putative disease resistance RPP13-like protein 1 [Ananas comosus]|uniref:Putative disease resistance RPP13-like protein 1 n=1 Tax=Ananas comosus TaxID=4615 RepID=A0A199V917_ANACO|nr:putative disease resistance RPP13-like protein 1 [Ananas comosus]
MFLGSLCKQYFLQVVRLLISASVSNFDVIPIVGMGGLGKTTLAQLVYNDPRVRPHFNRRAWVSVSENVDILRVTKAIIESMTNQPCALTELSALQEALRKETEEKCVLLVLDDMWNVNRNLWECFRVSLIGAETVRILITSRNSSVTKNIQTMLPYRLDYLPKDKSMRLFQQHAFGRHDPNAHPNLLEIGHKIVKKCGGLPLVLKTLGGLLRYEVDEEKWIDTLESDLCELDEGRSSILPALKLSYNHLPKHLKPCFLYFSAFPKGHEFQKDTIVRMWIAHNYIDPKANKSLEEIGGEYFDELQGRFLLDSFRKYGRDMYRVHDMLHDLAKSVSRNEMLCYISNMVQRLYGSENQMSLNFLSAENPPKAVRSLLNYSLDTDLTDSQIIFSKLACLRVLELNLHALSELPDSIGGLKHLRYLSVIGRKLQKLPELVCLLYNLQTLDLQHCSSLVELPEAIGNLINLRYIRLRSTKIEKLPETVFLLSSLRFLDLNSCYRLKELPGCIKQLTSLCSLDISHTKIHRIPHGLGMLTNLRKLEASLEGKSDDRHGGLGELKNLVKLGGTLCISRLENVVDLEHVKRINLESKRNLRSLKLKWTRPVTELREVDKKENDKEEGQLHLEVSSNDIGEANNGDIEEVLNKLQPHRNISKLTIDGYTGTKFPCWMGDPFALSQLTTLFLTHCYSRETNVLPPLGRLPSLTSLSVTGVGVEKLGDEFCGNSVAFPSLERLEFKDMPKWEEWVGVLSGDFPQLKQLSIKYCPKLWKLLSFPALCSFCIYECESLKSLSLCQEQGSHPALQILSIKGCQQLTSLLGLDNLRKIEKLEISDCGIHELELSLHSKLQYVHIARCWRLASVSGLHTLTSVTSLRLACCPQLHLSCDEKLCSVPTPVEVVDCPRLVKWCHKNKCDYVQKISALRGLTLSDDEEMPSALAAHNLPSVEHLCIKNSEQSPSASQSYQFYRGFIGFFPNDPNVPMLERLELSNCREVVSIAGLNSLNSLQHLLIRDCPELLSLPDEWLPSALDSFVVRSCDKLTSLPPLSGNLQAFQELQIVNCPKLTRVTGLQNIRSLSILIALRCEQLRISPDERLGSVPQNVLIKDCPMMTEWCLRYSIPYARVSSQFSYYVKS